MKNYIVLLILLLISFSSNAQVFGPNKLKSNREFRSILSAGGGLVLQYKYGEWNNSFNISVELDIHLGKGFFIGGGVLNHSIPVNKYNEATYLFLQGRKGFYLFDRFVVMGGIGGAIGATNHGHPGCCLGGAYFSISAMYDLHRYFGIGMENKVITDFDDIYIIPGVHIYLRM